MARVWKLLIPRGLRAGDPGFRQSEKSAKLTEKAGVTWWRFEAKREERRSRVCVAADSVRSHKIPSHVFTNIVNSPRVLLGATSRPVCENLTADVQRITSS